VAATALFAFSTGDGGAARSVGFVALLFAVPGLFLGIALVVMSRTRYTAAVVPEDAVTCEWRAGWPTRARHRVQAAGAGLFVVVLAVWLVSLVRDVGWPASLLPALLGPPSSSRPSDRNGPTG
jgi:hypothetical protein